MTKSLDTIFALSSGALPSGVAVYRLSGDRAFAIAEDLAGKLSPARQASLRTIRLGNGLVLDRGLVLIFPAPHSFTGDDCVELHLHGSKAVAKALLEDLASRDGCRLAEHGEFTRRALDNGRIDLLEVEGLADLLAAETEMQRRLAIEHSSGHLSALYGNWAERLTRARAMIEAELDFADEDDVPGSVSTMIWTDMGALADELRRHLHGAAFGEIIRDGLHVVIAGEPNAGKSSLMNALAQRDVAIVTDIAGTTRDVLHVDLDVGGYAVRLYDTAGLRETNEIVEQEGIRRALKTIGDADLVLSLAEIGTPAARSFAQFGGDVLTIGTKLDLHGDSAAYDLCLSAVTSAGIAALRDRLQAYLTDRAEGLSLSLPSRERQKQWLVAALEHLTLATERQDMDLDLRAEALRLAAQDLGRITGRVDVEDLLGIIFSEFCIGK